MTRKTKAVFRIGNKFSFNAFNCFKGARYVGRFEMREYDEVVSWSFVFADYATEDAAANQWVTEQRYVLNEVK